MSDMERHYAVLRFLLESLSAIREAKHKPNRGAARRAKPRQSLLAFTCAAR